MQASVTSPTSEPSLAVRARARGSRYASSIALVSLILLILYFALAADNFISGLAISNIISFAGVFGIIVVGVAMLMIGGEFDLSVGAVLAVASYVFALTLTAGVPPLLAMLISVAFGAGLGLLNGLIVVYTGIPSFIATLGTMLAYRGIARALGGGDFAKYDVSDQWLFQLLNGPMTRLNELFTPAANFRMSILWFALIAVIASLVMSYTRFGNWVYAVGGNRESARAQGVAVQRVKLTTFLVCGLLAAFAGVVQFSERGSVDPLRGLGWELLAVVACVLGGIPLTGGAGAVSGAVIGVFILQVLEQGLVLMGASVQVFRAIVGGILILSVMLTSWLSRTD